MSCTSLPKSSESSLGLIIDSTAFLIGMLKLLNCVYYFISIGGYERLDSDFRNVAFLKC